jgi:hypothetical protein
VSEDWSDEGPVLGRRNKVLTTDSAVW